MSMPHSNPIRSAEYILTPYRTQRDQSAFYTVGAEERLIDSPPAVSELAITPLEQGTFG